MAKKRNVLWMAIDTKDKYKLPLYVADTARELAEHFGVPIKTVWESASHAKERDSTRSRYIAVEMGDE